ncbi:MAG TPA: cob(I)yrinic acid a,c-diamide adenosyltransferase [Thermomicrobiales bacterium]|jgi:cob(I)alamin adenosyltransferase|nr:cob(I)yrinic acid a,c-diamide adenosyltransferase [Thermomicrobiales bacterium]
MRLYTGKGDTGTTDLLGARVGKDDARIEILGQLDETSAACGLARAQATQSRTRDLLIDVQRDLYAIMVELAFTPEIRPDDRTFPAERTIWLEEQTDRLGDDVPLPPQFVIPGESVAGATLDVARTVVRRAERVAVTLGEAGVIDNGEILRYLNRLSSLLFILARFEDREAGAAVRLAKGDGAGR